MVIYEYFTGLVAEFLQIFLFFRCWNNDKDELQVSRGSFFFCLLLKKKKNQEGKMFSFKTMALVVVETQTHNYFPILEVKQKNKTLTSVFVCCL